MEPVLTPQPDQLPPPGYTSLDVAVATAPQRIPLFDAVAVVLSLPTGEALSWLQADPAAPASSSDPGSAPAPGTGHPGHHHRPARPRRRRTDAGRSAAGRWRAGGIAQGRQPGRGALVNIAVLTWQLTAATVVGAASANSRLRLGWRRANLAPSQFRPPAVNPKVLFREGLGQAGAG